MKSEKLRNVAGIFLFYLIIVMGVVLINYRLGEINDYNQVVSMNR